MKIYNKRNFFTGILQFVFGIIFFIDYFSNKNIFRLYMGVFFILISIDRIKYSLNEDINNDDKTFQQDERNVLLRAKSKEKTLIVFENFISFVVFILVISYMFFQKQFIIPYLLIFITITIILNFLEIYYRKKLEKNI